MLRLRADGERLRPPFRAGGAAVKTGVFAKARVPDPRPSIEVLNALEGADWAILTLSASVVLQRSLTFQENATLELAIERERIRQEFRRRDAAAACGTIKTLWEK